MTEFSPAAQQWLARATHIASQNLRATPMRGANSSTLCLLHDTRDDTRRFVLRIFTHHEWLQDEPDVPHHELAALNEARRAGINAPEPLAICEDDALFGAPAVLMSYLHGQANLRPANREIWLTELAAALANLHRQRAPDFAWAFGSWVDAKHLTVPHWTKAPQLWQRAFDFWHQGAPNFEAVFLHRDYHPLNVLWHNDRICGIVDWPNACRGPALADVARCRGNLMLLFDVETADKFLCKYLQRSGTAYQAFWDVDEILNFCLPRPEWYRPWSEFGLSELSAETLQTCADAFLKSVLARV